MIIIGDTLVSEDIFAREFTCNLNACKGACCIEGDAGAPLDPDELPRITVNLEAISEELSDDSKNLLAETGFYEIDTDGEPVTTCLPDGTCVFAIRDELNRLKCGMEEAHRKGTSNFIKPISCHLYPIRVSEIGEYKALNYHQWDICSAACDHGKKLQIRVFEFAGVALKRKFGEEWYREMEEIGKHI